MRKKESKEAFFGERRYYEDLLEEVEEMVYYKLIVGKYLEKAGKSKEEILKEAFREMEEFKDIYPQEVIEGDKKNFVEKLNSLRPKSRISEILEGIIFHFGETEEWFGEEGITVESSYFDDFFYGTDLIIEFDFPDGEKRLAVDVTANSNHFDLKQKLAITGYSLKKGHFNELHYFQSQINPQTRGKIELPRLVIGVGREEVTKLCRLLMPLAEESFLEDRKKARKEIASHYIQRQLLEEMINQLKEWRRYALEFLKFSSSHPIVVTVEEYLDKLESIYQKRKKKSLEVPPEALGKDTTYRNLVLPFISTSFTRAFL